MLDIDLSDVNCSSNNNNNNNGTTLTDTYAISLKRPSDDRSSFHLYVLSTLNSKYNNAEQETDGEREEESYVE